VNAVRSAVDRGSRSGHVTQTQPPPGTQEPRNCTHTQQEERQRSGSLASTSKAGAVEAQASPLERNGAKQALPNLVAMAKALVTSKHDAMIFNLALPSLLALAADPLLAITDTAFVGQLGNNELAAFSVNSSVFTFAFLVFNFLSTATTPAVATALATDDKVKAGETITQALLLALVLGGGAAGVLTLQATPVLEIMGVGPDDSNLYNLALQFLYIRATAAPAALLVSVSQGVFRGLQDMRTPLGVTVATNLLHLALSLGFIFQLRMGLPGAALSISLAEWAAALTYLALGWSKRSQLGLDLGWTREVRGAISSSSSSSSPGSGWRPRADSAGDEGWRMEDNGVPTGGAVDGMGASSSQPQSSSSSSITNTTPATINSNGNGKYEAGGKGAPALPVVGNLKSSTATGGSPNSDSSVASTNGRRAALSESTATPSGANGSASADSVDGRVASTSGRPALLEPPTTASTVRQGQAPVGATLRAFFASYAPFLQAGGAVLLRTGLLLGTKTLASAVAMRLGPEQMSTHQILYQVWLLASLAVDSLAISGQVAVAVNLGKGDLNAAREVSDRLLQLGVGLGGMLALVLLIADPIWPRTFTQEADVVASVQALSPLALALLPINSVVYVLDGVFVGANDYAFLVKAMLVAAMLGTPLLLAVQPLNWGLEGVWWGLSALMIGRCLGLLYRYNSPAGPVPPLALAEPNAASKFPGKLETSAEDRPIDIDSSSNSSNNNNNNNNNNNR